MAGFLKRLAVIWGVFILLFSFALMSASIKYYNPEAWFWVQAGSMSLMLVSGIYLFSKFAYPGIRSMLGGSDDYG